MNREHFFVPGIRDEDFIREAGVPMTKNEIRVLSLARLRLFPGAVVYDVGAGTGSIAIECKLLIPDSHIFAVEQEPRAVQLLKLNMDKFGVELNLIEGPAPEVLEELPLADRIFIGGSGGRLPDIINFCDKKLKNGGWMIINSISIHNSSQAFSILEDKGYQVDAIQVNIAVSSNRGKAKIWQARNPVTIISGQKEARHHAIR
jgi:cobalt-precorrin-6B (C15)-methyltransferase